MNNVYTLNKPEDTLARASEWLAKMDRGLSSIEELQLQDWLGAHKDHAEVFLQVSEQWDQMDSLSRLADLFPEPITDQSTWHISRPVFAVAASLMVAVLLSVLTVVDVNFSALSQRIAFFNTTDEKRFETNIGEQSTVSLADGSQIQLNTNSAIRTQYSASERRLILERGEVHIQVAHDKSRPLRVFVGNNFVQAVGTAFNIQLFSDNKVELIVTEGEVLVGAREAPVDAKGGDDFQPSVLFDTGQSIVAGEQILLGDNNEVVKLAPSDIKMQLSWTGGNLIFRGEPLVEVIAEIERYTPVKIIILGDELKQLRVAGLFRTGDVEGLLTTLSENFDISYQRVNEGEIILTKK